MEQAGARTAAYAAEDRAASFEWAARCFEPTAEPGDNPARP